MIVANVPHLGGAHHGAIKAYAQDGERFIHR